MVLLSAGTSLLIRRPVLKRLNEVSRALLLPDDGPAIDFERPLGERALAAPDSVSWRIFKNPVSLFIGGIAAVILELAEPRVRTGVWEHSGFRSDPVRRLRRTGLAAMVTVYGARSVAEAMIARIRGIHDRVQGQTPSGEAYRANDPELLNWVHATAAYGFLRAYHTYVAPLAQSERDRYYTEAGPAAALYGVTRVAASEADIAEIFQSMRPRLERSPIVFDFLAIMRNAPVLPPVLRPMQPLFVRAAISLTPPWVQEVLGLAETSQLRGWQTFLVTKAGAAADRIMLESSPAAQACLRLGLPANYLYGHGSPKRLDASQSDPSP
jgi:uncharacterized protein (DUF2236 family)